MSALLPHFEHEIVQPHRFTRLRDLFADFAACFNDADTVIMAPVYAAGEEPIDGVNSEIEVDIRSMWPSHQKRLRQEALV